MDRWVKKTSEFDVFFILGTMYQASVEYNMNISLYPNSHYNPNEPQGFYDQNRTYFGEVSCVCHIVSSVYICALLRF